MENLPDFHFGTSSNSKQPVVQGFLNAGTDHGKYFNGTLKELKKHILIWLKRAVRGILVVERIDAQNSLFLCGSGGPQFESRLGIFRFVRLLVSLPSRQKAELRQPATWR